MQTHPQRLISGEQVSSVHRLEEVEGCTPPWRTQPHHSRISELGKSWVDTVPSHKKVSSLKSVLSWWLQMVQETRRKPRWDDSLGQKIRFNLPGMAVTVPASHWTQLCPSTPHWDLPSGQEADITPLGMSLAFVISRLLSCPSSPSAHWTSQLHFLEGSESRQSMEKPTILCWVLLDFSSFPLGFGSLGGRGQPACPSGWGKHSPPDWKVTNCSKARWVNLPNQWNGILFHLEGTANTDVRSRVVITSTAEEDANYLNASLASILIRVFCDVGFYKQ